MNFKSFVLDLNINEIILLLRLWSKHGINCTTFTHRDYNYLIKSYLKSNTILEFYKYYICLPIDTQEPRYFESIITYYKNIYKEGNYSCDSLRSTSKNPRLPSVLYLLAARAAER